MDRLPFVVTESVSRSIKAVDTGVHRAGRVPLTSDVAKSIGPVLYQLNGIAVCE
jgi:hypothetical protein